MKLNGFYRGVVEDNVDPDKRGRVRARIWGIHTKTKVKSDLDGIPTEELPWSEPCLPIMEGGVGGFGMFGVPVQGSHIMIFFENGNINQARYFASMPGNPTEDSVPEEGFNDPDGKYPQRIDEPDWHRLARGVRTDTLIQTRNEELDTIEPTSPAQTQYPHNWVINTHGGITIELDSTPGAERLNIYHPSNSYIEIDVDGNMVIRSTRDKYDITIGSKKKHVRGDEEDTIDGNLDITVAGTVNIKAASINLN